MIVNSSLLRGYQTFDGSKHRKTLIFYKYNIAKSNNQKGVLLNKIHTKVIMYNSVMIEFIITQFGFGKIELQSYQ